MADKSKNRSCIGIGCISVIVLALVSCGLFAYQGKQAWDSTEPVIEQFFSTMEAGEFVKSYDLLGPSFQSEMSQEEFSTMLSLLKTALGPLKSRDVAKVFYRNVNGEKRVEARISAQYTKSKVDVNLVLMPANDEMKIHGFNFNSPTLMLEQMLLCNWCNAKQPKFSLTCHTCGKTIDHIIPGTPITKADEPTTAAATGTSTTQEL